MKRHWPLVLILFVSLPVFAQELTEEFRGPDSGTDYQVHGIQVLPLPGKPFSGRDHVEWNRVLEDGTSLKTELYAKMARDGSGRIYREFVTFVPAGTIEESRRLKIVLLNPLTHTATTCLIANKVCTVTGYYASVHFAPPPVGSFDEGKRFLTRVDLGNAEIGGFPVIGTRETISVNTATVGNNQPLVSTKEFWYSPELEINLSVLRKDPREGTQILQVVDLSRAEPDPSIFDLPAGFTVKDTRPAMSQSKTGNL